MDFLWKSIATLVTFGRKWIKERLRFSLESTLCYNLVRDVRLWLVPILIPSLLDGIDVQRLDLEQRIISCDQCLYQYMFLVSSAKRM
jgi:hypothetical protein